MEKTKIQLSDHFGYKRLVRFVLPSVAMMIFTSIYCVVDGLFVSNFTGETPFAALNLIFPLIMILGAVGFMLGTGGTAIVAKTLGMGQKELANRYFSFLVYFAIGSGAVLSVLGIILAPTFATMLGATGALHSYCVLYARIVLLGLPFFMLQNLFQSFCITAEKPKLGLLVTVGAGVTNMVLDALFVWILDLGLGGAASATALSQFIGGVVPLIYFSSKKGTGTLHLGKTRFYGACLLKTCFNGSSELLSNIASSLVTILYNAQLMRIAGQAGIAAYGAIMYVAFIFIAIFIGFVIGSSPIVSFHYGAGNTDELKNLFKKSLVIMGACGFTMTALAVGLSRPLSYIFVGYNPELCEMTARGFLIYAFCYLFAGFNIFGSAFFTALNNGIISAVLSFLRTIVFQCVAVSVFPYLFGLDGVWVSTVASDASTLIVTVTFLYLMRKRYKYT